MLMLVPSAWENLADMEPAIRAFYEYNSLLSEPWDGPAALAFSDGTIAGAVLLTVLAMQTIHLHGLAASKSNLNPTEKR